MFRVAGLTAVVVCLLAAVALGQAPNLMSFQGRLTNSGGSPLNGSYNLTFSIYNTPAGGVAIWTETQNSVPVTDGLFAVLLGSVNPFTRFGYLGAPTFGDTSAYVGVSVNGGSELTPRTRIVSSPWAMRVFTIDGALGGLINDNITLYGWLNFGPGNLTDCRLSIPSDRQFAAVFTTNQASSSAAAVKAEYTAVGNWDGTGVVGKSVPADYYGVGGYFEGGYVGAQARVYPTGPNQYFGLDAQASGGTGTNVAVRGAASNLGVATGMHATGSGASGAYGVRATATISNTSGSAYGVYGEASGMADGYGVYGDAKASGTNVGVWGQASGSAVFNYGVFGTASGGLLANYAGFFSGNVTVTGTLSKGGGAFKIDHPLDPENKYLQHSFVESPDMMNIYNGNVATDETGTAVVTLPDYFEALNRDFRYQLTVIGQFAQAIIGQEIENRQFTIKSDKPNVKVSWQVTGIRHDAWAEKNRIQVEVQKNSADKGLYLHPEAFGLTPDKGIGYAQQKEMDAQRAATEKALQSSKESVAKQ